MLETYAGQKVRQISETYIQSRASQESNILCNGISIPKRKIRVRTELYKFWSQTWNATLKIYIGVDSCWIVALNGFRICRNILFFHPFWKRVSTVNFNWTFKHGPIEIDHIQSLFFKHISWTMLFSTTNTDCNEEICFDVPYILVSYWLTLAFYLTCIPLCFSMIKTMLPLITVQIYFMMQYLIILMISGNSTT